MATPTDDDNADDCISGNYYGYERGGTLGILGRLAQAKRIPLSVPEVAKLFGVKPKTVYKNIKRNEALAARIQEMLKALAGCIIAPRRNVDKTIFVAGIGCSCSSGGHTARTGLCLRWESPSIHWLYQQPPEKGWGFCRRNLKHHLFARHHPGSKR